MSRGALRDDLQAYHARLSSEAALTWWRSVRYALSYKMFPVTLIRASAWLSARSVPVLPRLLQLLNFLVYGIETRPRCDIGGGLFLPHTHGTVIGARSIGRNCTIFQGVTLGASQPDLADIDELRPVIGDDVTIGSGAKVIGAITIGTGSTIGANAVVTRDVPPDSLVLAGHPVVRPRPD